MNELVSLVYGGPNRRSELTVIEKSLEVSTGELECFARRNLAGWWDALEDLHATLTIARVDDHPAGGAGSLPMPDQMAWLYASTSVSLQRAAGHLVMETGFVVSSSPDRCRPFYEYEEPETGQEAGEIVLEAFSLLWGGTGSPTGTTASISVDEQETLAARIDRFLSESRPKAMPADSRAIFDAAMARGIPCLRMDRPPFDPIEGDFRVRYNGLFRLGHGHRQHTVDGTFCVSRSEPVFSLVYDRSALFDRLEELSVPLPGNGPNRWFQAAAKAGKFADRMGYPVCLRADRRGRGHLVSQALSDRESVMKAAGVALQYSSRLLVQPYVAGSVYKLVVAHDSVIAALEKIPDQTGVKWQTVAGFHPSIEALSRELAKTFSVGLLAITVVTPDLRMSLEECDGAVVDVELAPQLDRLFGPDDPRLQQAAGAFVDWIFPDPGQARIPVVAVTGTNGKTTTCRMLNSIMTAAGFSTGLACSDGSFVAGRAISQYEDGFLPGHISILDNPQVEAAVLESTRGAAGTTGLGFDQCDVAVCLNVTADHLNDFVGTRSVEQLARLKRTIMERARDAVVLNVDDAHCRDMITHLGGRNIGLVSLHNTPAQLAELAGGDSTVAALEQRDNQNWLIIEQHGRQIPVVAENDIPLTFNGAAEHNTANALHAALAAHLMQVPAECIAKGLCDLKPVYESVPGRLTFYRQLPFEVCMDYAHNPDGVRKLCEFTDKLPVSGRRILCFSCSNANSDDFIRETAVAAAGSFDHYICKNFSYMFGRQPEEGPRLLREGLLAAGVSPGTITCIEAEPEAIDAALDMGQKGDLVVIIGGKRRDQLWQQIVSRGSG